MTNTKGFTLVELLLYTGIVGVMLLAISVLLSLLTTSRVKNQTIAEVEQQGVQVMQIISQAVRNADAIVYPPQGMDSNYVVLDVFTDANDPSTFDILDGVIRITEGSQSPVVLTNSRVIASGLSVKNLSHTGTPGIVQIQFSLNHINPNNRNEYEFNQTFTTSISLR